MLMLSPRVKVFLALEPHDLRKSIDGLSAAARAFAGNDPLSGHLFVFLNRRRSGVKILAWDRNGFCVLYKRLELGTFALPKVNATSGQCEMDAADLAMMLDGVELSAVRRRARWKPQKNNSEANTAIHAGGECGTSLPP